MPLTKVQKRKIEEEEQYRAQVKGKLSQPLQVKTNRNRVLAGVLAIIFGGLGVHKFYLGQPGWGILYLIFTSFEEIKSFSCQLLIFNPAHKFTTVRLRQDI